FDNVTVLFLVQHFFTTEITGKVQHEWMNLPRQRPTPGAASPRAHEQLLKPSRREPALHQRPYPSVAGFPVRVKLNLGNAAICRKNPSWQLEEPGSKWRSSGGEILE